MNRDQFDALPLMLTVEEAAPLLRIGRTATYEAIRQGVIPSMRVGRAIRVPKHRLADMLGLSDDGTQPIAAPPAHSDNGAATGRGANMQQLGRKPHV